MNTNNLYSCSYIQELNELEADGYSQEEAMAIMADLESEKALERSNKLLEISKIMKHFQAQGMTREQALEEVKPLLNNNK